MIDLNDDAPTCTWTELLAAATNNAATDFEIEFCDSLRQKLERFGARAKLTDAQFHKLTCIAQAGGFWERDQ
jgi:hypothetical protein